MKTQPWIIIIILAGLSLTACAANNNAPTPTIIPLDRSQSAQEQAEAVERLPTATPIPPPSPTPTFTPFVLTALLELTPTSAPTPGATQVQVEVIANALYLRAGPGVDYPPVGGARKGDRFEVLGVHHSGQWLQIVTATGQIAWISAKADYTRLNSATPAELPLIGDLAATTGTPAAATGALPTTANPQAKATRNDLSGQLVFQSSSGGNLYALNIDGSNLRLLASGVIDPVVSPDGQQVAFTRWDGAEVGTLYVVNIDGSNERAILGETLQAKSPAWSPDGQSIILSFQHGGLRNPPEECRDFDFDDGISIPDNVAKITSFKVTKNDISICFIRREDLRWGLRQVDLSSGQFEDLGADLYSYNPAWDPQQPWRVIYDGDKGLMQLDVTNGQLWPITTDLRDTGPVFSPDGQRLALTYKQHDHWEVYTLDLETGERQRLTKPPLLADPQYNSAAPAWSPDGQHLTFLTDRSGQWEIWVMRADGSDPRPLFLPETQTHLELEYRGVNERMLNWIE